MLISSIICFCGLLAVAQSLYQDEAGVTDVSWWTTGHGPVKLASVVDQVLLSYGDETYLAGRHWQTGALLWRLEIPNAKFYLSPAGIIISQQKSDRVMGWEPRTGTLLWDQRSVSVPKLMEDDVISLDSGLFDIRTGISVAEAKKSTEKLSDLAGGSTSVVCQSRELAVSPEGTIAIGEQTVDANLLWLLKCDESGIFVLSSSVRGTTSVLNLSSDSIAWSSQEGLAGASSAVLVNADPALPPEATSKLLNLQQRWVSQFQSLKTPMSSEWRNHLFGLHKIAVLLNSKYHRLFGLDSISGDIAYQMDLPMDSEMHKLVEHPDEHHQVLALSLVKQQLQCTCFDASTGKTQSMVTLSLKSSIQQIVPVLGSGACAVGAIFVLDDGTVQVSDESISIPDNLYSHKVSTNSVQTYRIWKKSAQLVGATNFPGEVVVETAYPNRHEVTESPCKVLGDNSLLLKYLNPHIMVVVTKATEEIDPLLGRPSKRKPAGVEGTNVESLNIPKNMFVNVVDTVSGKLLYRIGHFNADASSIKVLISEHWILYTFTNTKTLKAELGVLSLYEGMIEKNGLTAFTSPQQSTIHSSLDAPAPVVLAKTYVLPQKTTGLGMTVTQAGISGRRVVLATIDGKLHTIDRHVLEPRRPVGPVNDNEKKEGLVQYHELVPLIPLMTLSYNLTIEDVTKIQSAATHLESQTIVLAYGGPDIFLTRTSPSRGFDILPESFSRPLILLVVAILGGTLIVLQNMVAKKVVQEGWL